ncbi:carbohydrate-binding family 9-like protein [Cyclobacterium roseum]|uniref:carbohydrate-binding family 9-like protein n=1 Tax=Cyclobacterium roseum TaxID=2666137 RepID=UPI001F1C4B1E|nr:carbohydrate-binding family 9-like protein [Cyclobacterium roseum]
MQLIYFLFVLFFVESQNAMPDSMNSPVPNPAEYLVQPVNQPLTIDGNWEKPEWKEVPAADISLHMGEKPAFSPRTQVKLRYDKQNIYGIFKVEDRFVQALVQEINGPVSTDSCVEFFFSPDVSKPLEYFNLEINAAGVPLFHHVTSPRKEYEVVNSELIKKIEIAHSLPGEVIPEIKEATTWYIEFRLPVELLKQYRTITSPAPGVVWKANFYKTGSRTSNPHYITWNEVINQRPDFHLPKYFGNLIFQ